MSDFALFQRLLVTWGLIAVLWAVGPGAAIVSSLNGDMVPYDPAPALLAVVVAVYAAAHIIAIILSAHWIRQNRHRI